LTKTKVEQIKSLTEHAMSIITTYQEYDSMSAALYYMGAARFAFADIAFEAPPPKDLSEAELEVYRQLVDEKFRVPSEDAGRVRLQAALDKAKAEKRWSNWNSMALSAINERFPSGARSAPAETDGRAVIGVLDAEYVALKAANWVASEQKNVEMMNAKLDQAKALRDHARKVLAEHPQDEVAAAAEYYAGVAFLAFADLVYHMPAPNGLSADELHVYEQAAGEGMVIPSEDKGREALEASLQKATQDNRWSKWHSKMLGALNDTFGAAGLDQVFLTVDLPFSGPLSSRPISMGNSGESVKDVLDTADQAKLEAAVALLLVSDATQAQRALDELNALVTRHPDQAILHFNKGIAWMALGDDGHAREAWERALSLDVNFDSARRNIAVLDFRKGQTSDGLRTIQTGLKSNARSVDLQVAAIAALRAEMRYDEAIQQGKAALSVNSRAMPLFCELALVYIDTNQVDIAKFLIEKAVMDLGEASSAQAHAILGQIYSRKGDIGAALAEFQKAISIDPLQVSALRSLGSYYLDNRAYDDALPILTRAVAAEPRDSGSHLALAIVYRELGRLGDAQEEYKAALSVHAKHPEPWRNLTVRVGSDIKVYNAALELIAQSVHSQDGSADTVGITATGNVQSGVSNAAVDPSVVSSVVQRSEGSFQSCVEAGASRNRALAGTIVFGWSIASGRVVNISNIENSSGDAALGTCFASVIRLMRFDPSVNYTVGAYTFPISVQQAAPNTPVKATRKPASSSDLWGAPASY
jgi:tetratricopeptide (TPR) repeat protein